jgi:hypothetical protein
MEDLDFGSLELLEIDWKYLYISAGVGIGIRISINVSIRISISRTFTHSNCVVLDGTVGHGPVGVRFGSDPNRIGKGKQKGEM